MAISIYEFPELFRAVHMEEPGEIAQEAAFLKRVCRRHLKRPLKRALDIACGDSPHALILARDGAIEVVGVDRSAAMLAAGRRKAQGRLPIRFYRRAIERFTLPERPFDLAFFMSETFPVMTGNTAILSHLRSVARLLRRGAIYCIDIDRHDIPAGLRGRKLWRRRRVRHGKIAIDISEYRRPMPWYAGAWIYELRCRIRLPERTVHTADLVPVRYTLPNQLDFAAKACGDFELAACYADLSFATPIERCDRRWLAVLRRL